MTPPQNCKCDVIQCVPHSGAGFPELRQVKVGDVPGSVLGLFRGRPRGRRVGGGGSCSAAGLPRGKRPHAGICCMEQAGRGTDDHE